MAVEKRIVVGASGASGMPLLMKCLEFCGIVRNTVPFW